MFKNLKKVLVVFNIFFFFISIGLYAKQINPTKQELWDRMSAEVSQWTDGIGYPIDQEIKDTVVALNLIGIETTGSCEGHLDHGLSYPWVDIQIYPSELKKMMQEMSDIQEQISNEEIFLKTKFPNLSRNDFYDILEGENLKILNEKHFFIGESIRQIQIKCLEPLNLLLNQFYENHKSSYGNTLIVTSDSIARLRSIGANRQQIRSQEQQTLKLNEYREEMKAFTIFLKKKFMN